MRTILRHPRQILRPWSPGTLKSRDYWWNERVAREYRYPEKFSMKSLFCQTQIRTRAPWVEDERASLEPRTRQKHFLTSPTFNENSPKFYDGQGSRSGNNLT